MLPKLDDGVLEKWNIDLEQYEMWVDAVGLVKMLDAVKTHRGIETDGELAGYLNLPRQSIGNIRRNLGKVHRVTAINYLNRLGVDPKNLLHRKAPKGTDPAVLLLADIYKDHIHVMIEHSTEILEFIKGLEQDESKD